MAGRAGTPIPDGWRTVRLGEVLESAQGGGTPARGVAEYWSGTIPWATVKDMGEPTMGPPEESITEAGVGASATRVIPAGTVLIATRMAVGAVAWTTFDTAINQDLKALLPREALDGRFLFHFMLASQAKLEAAGSGTTVKGIGVDFVRSLPLLLPPLPEQRAIAAVLDSIDEAIERTEEVIAATERLRDALLHELLTRGLPGHHTSWRDVPGLGAIPACWEVVRLGDVADVKGGKRLPKGDSFAGEDTGFPYIRVVDFARRSVETLDLQFLRPETHRAIERYTIGSNDVYISIAGTIGLVGTIPARLDGANLTENAAKIVLGSQGRLSQLFLVSFLDSRAGHTQIGIRVNALGQPKLALERIRTIPVPLPPLPEQRAIAATLDSVDAATQGARAERAALQSSKASIADALLTGRVRVHRGRA